MTPEFWQSDILDSAIQREDKHEGHSASGGADYQHPTARRARSAGDQLVLSEVVALPAISEAERPLFGSSPGDSDLVTMALRWWHLANGVDVGTYQIIHLLRVRIAERVAHRPRDPAEERYQPVECPPDLLDIQ